MVNVLNRSMVKGIGLLLICFTGWLNAAPVPGWIADQAVGGWLKRNAAPMDVAISPKAQKAEGFADANGRILYYLVALEPRGFVVLSADDEIEPVIAFSATGYYDAAQDSPLETLLERDMMGRLEGVGSKGRQAAKGKSEAAGKWQTLLDMGADAPAKDGGGTKLAGLPSVSDVRVTPLLQSKWGQGDDVGGNCYNYYTPNHYPTGCVATAMAQLMRYHTKPTVGIGVHAFTIYVNGVPQSANTRGGNGSGGAYNWAQMPYDPEAGLTTTQRAAIGALCYDAGVTVGTGYTATGSGASTSAVSQALKGTFGYTNSVFGDNFSSSGDAGLWGMMNADLDAALPVILGISGPGVAHAIVADGYGYTGATMYHHLNMGWTGLDDAWYQLPVIEGSYNFNAITDCVYNVYPTGTGEIISGRITSLAGAPLDGVVVTAYQGASVIKQATTNSRGIYALKNLPSSASYRLAAVKSGYVFVDQMSSTGLSQDWNAVSGNKWGINFSATNPMPPTAMNQTVNTSSQTNKTIILEALDDHLPNPPASMVFIITSLPLHGSLSQPGGGPINTVPYTLAAAGNVVLYTPCVYFGGSDSFTFKANDGGTAPSGGDSNSATVTVNADNKLYSEFGTSGTTGTNTMINTTYYASRSQVLYLKDDIGAAKYLTDLAVNFTQLPPIPLKRWTIRLQHTNMTYYSDVVANFLTSGWTMVYQADVTVSQTGWTNFHFATPFHYNGTQNLLVDFSFNNTTVSANTGWYLFYNVGGSYDIDRMITIVTHQAVHSDPLTWDFWAGGGGYWGGDWLPSIKLIGTVPIDPIAGDFDQSCEVTLPDMAMLAVAWLTQQGQPNYNPVCDISNPKDNIINLSDLLVFVDHWLLMSPP